MLILSLNGLDISEFQTKHYQQNQIKNIVVASTFVFDLLHSPFGLNSTMQRGACKVLNEAHLNSIASKARLHNRECGYLWRRAAADSTSKWLGSKWYALYQNLLFGYENVNSTKASSVILLESAYCQKIITNVKNTKAGEIKLVSCS